MLPDFQENSRAFLNSLYALLFRALLINLMNLSYFIYQSLKTQLFYVFFYVYMIMM